MKKEKKEKKGTNLMDCWINENIFGRKKLDGAAYFALYIIIPIVITSITLMTLTDDSNSIIYCYMSIFISAINCIYDAMNRWKFDMKCILNTKLFIIIICNVIIIVYCIISVFYILMSKGASIRCDWLLLFYIVGAIVAVIDILVCFADNMAFKGYV